MSQDAPTVLLRFDMDALPIQEQNNCSYASVHTGKMHACGHDAHTANLLGVAMILSELRNELTGTYKLIFQPSEEKMNTVFAGRYYGTGKAPPAERVMLESLVARKAAERLKILIEISF